ncbi:MAG: hypothetical protein A4E41_01452 [Methanoregulaceae archaeon PtaU1.Bin066]|jgi:hypothetical protein|nr:MAG: hypothetical protein A4E41_01452 [Methanoregulaceae archaeon PtaU1.Bin066]
MTVAKNGRVERLTSGITWSGEKGGRTIVAPDANHQTPSIMIRTDGMMLPRITPAFWNFVDISSPKQAIAVVPQNAIIITTKRYHGLSPREGESANAKVEAMNASTVGNQTRLFDHSQNMATKPPFSPNASLHQA